MITWEEHVDSRLAGGSTLESTDLLGRLLREQQRLTAVERFAQKHERDELPAQSRYYHDLIPLSKPAKGEQYAFEVDLDTCSSCKACVTACHSLNGLREDETWRQVGVLVGGSFYEPERRTVTTACHHCADPACANGCPVLAYEKDAETGIVRHLDDQCIGCQYCVLKCPYEVPQYSKSLGIVRKCDMCHDRLAEGEAPACVQACPNEAIVIRIIKNDEIPKTGKLVPGTVDSGYTKPSTIYKGGRLNEIDLAPADRSRLVPEHTHLPLVLMLTLTQAGLGLVLADAILRFTGMAGGVPHLVVAALGALLCFAGLAASILHLGRPLQAWRAFLGWRRSWLSREIIAFGPWSGLVAASGTLLAVSSLPAVSPLLAKLPAAAMDWFPLAVKLSGFGAVALGLAAVFCSVMVYVDTRREFWRLPATVSRFFGNSAVFAAGGSLAVFAVEKSSFTLPALLVFTLVLLGKVGLEVANLRHAGERSWTSRKKSALLQLDALRPLLEGRLAFAALALWLAIAAILANWGAPMLLAALALLVGELCERAIYFKAVIAYRMPGEIHAGSEHT